MEHTTHINNQIDQTAQPESLVDAAVLEIHGSFDHVPGREQMALIHQALVEYFGTDDWIKARDRRQPGLG